MLNNKKKLFLLSLIAAIIISFIPGIGIRIEGTSRFFGFPAQWLVYYGGFRFSFPILGLLLNFFIFYFIFYLNQFHISEPLRL